MAPFLPSSAPLSKKTIHGIPIKQAVLIALTLHTSALILVMHYSRISQPSNNTHMYFPSTAVFLSELIKFGICAVFALRETSASLAPNTPFQIVYEQVYNAVLSRDGLKLAVPAILYTVQNTLQYVAVGNLDPVHFQILYEFKILTTALFSVLILRRPLGMRRWFALILLTLGGIVVSLPDPYMAPVSEDDRLLFHDTSDHWFQRSQHEMGQVGNNIDGDVARELTKRSATYEGIQDDQDPYRVRMNRSLGVATAMCCAVISGLTGVYFEKLLKDSHINTSLWTRNVQLCFYSLFPAFFIGVVMVDGADIVKHGFFTGYSPIVWLAILFQAVGGVLTSLCIRYADNIAKNFATSISILVSFVLSLCFFHVHISPPFILGAVLVLVATFIYSAPEGALPALRPSPIRVANLEKMTIDHLMTPRPADDTHLNSDPMDSLSVHTATLSPISAAGGPGSLTGASLSSSRPASPMVDRMRVASRKKENELWAGSEKCFY